MLSDTARAGTGFPAPDGTFHGAVHGQADGTDQDHLLVHRCDRISSAPLLDMVISGLVRVLS